MDPAREAAARRLRLAIDLFDAGEALMRQRLRRQYPGLAPAAIEGHLIAWLQTRPGAEAGDAPGRPSGVAPAPPLSRLEAVLRRAATDLNELGHRWAVVGALAVSARAEPRFTRDIDLAVAVGDDAEAERLVRELQDRRYRVPSVVEQEAIGRLATARLVPSGEDDAGVVVDLLLASSGIESEVVTAAEPLEVFPGLSLPVATTAHLIALKVLARDDRTRPQDRVDLVALLAVATAADLEQARAALTLITGRGYHPGKNLLAELEAFLAGRSR